MSDDQPFYSPIYKPAAERQPKPGELLFEFMRGHIRFRCELRFHGESYGWEARFYRNEEFELSRRFLTKALAIEWAQQERHARETWCDE